MQRHGVWLAALCACLWASTSGHVLAQDDTAEATEGETPGLGQDVLPEPPDPEAPDLSTDLPDTLGTSAGEFLVGEIHNMTADDLVFTSDVLGEVTVARSDIQSLTSSRGHAVVLTSGEELQATMTWANGRVALREGTREVVVDQAEIDHINPDPPETEWDKWSGSLTLGFTATFGNTRQRTITSVGSLTREDEDTRLSLGYTGTYGYAEGEENARAHRGDFQLDYSITERLYLTPVFGNLTYDKFQNIALRARIGAGAGWHLVLPRDFDQMWTWDVEAGGTYVRTRFRRVQPNEDRTRDEVSIRLATSGTVSPFDPWDLEWSYEVYIGVFDIEDTVHRATGTFHYRLMDHLSLEVSAVYDRVEQPERDSDGRLPKRDDLRTYVGITVDF